jgi:pyrrolidone-carboxylate peptidase
MAKTAVFCTGFGDFLGVKGNPTAAVVDALPAFLEKDLPAVQASNPWELKLAETLNVSIQGCKLALAQIEEAVESESRPCVLLHLGVAPRASASLEIQAWNEATFRVPDEK